MPDFLTKLFDTGDFPARWHCGIWSAAHGWTHILADLAIAAAYAAIPFSIALYVAQKKRDVAFPRLYWLFAAFIVTCGSTHLIEATMFWHPWYRLSALLKVITAVFSWLTVYALMRALPTAVALPGAIVLNEQLSREIDEHRCAREEVQRLNLSLQHRIEELQTLFDVLPVGIGISTDSRCEVIRSNQTLARMLKLPPDANAALGALRKDPAEDFRLFGPQGELSAEQLPLQVAAMEDRVERDFEAQVVFHNGEKIDLLGYAAPLHDEKGAVRGAVGAFIDMTRLKRAEAERQTAENKLRESRKLESLGVMAGGIAHDFNNLLTCVIGNTSLIRMEFGAESPALEYIKRIEEASHHAAGLCKQMLACAGKGRFVLQKFDLSELVNQSATLLEASTGQHASLGYDLAGDLALVCGDTTQMRQILLNLVINAAEAMGAASGTIEIATGKVPAQEIEQNREILAANEPGGLYVFLQVRDSGSGMSAETRARIFDPFFTTKFTGRGLGLAAVQGIVRGHRGALNVESTPGEGTTFRILLPAHVECASPLAL